MDSAAQPPPPTNPDTLTLTILHHGTTHTFTFPTTATLTDLTTQITATLSIPSTYQKFMISPKTGLLKPPYPNPPLPLTTLLGKRIQLLAPLPTDLTNLAPPPKKKQQQPTPSPLKPSHPSKHKPSAHQLHAESTYTFHTLLALPYLPHPERSLHFLERLRSDPGIKFTMQKHRFRVNLLTEMNPAEHTTHESKTLGLNRNHGQVIELRLRTDAYDGYRDYKTIRKTLCHELAHNVHGEHDRKFWELMKQIENEVERADWTRGGYRLSEEVFYQPGEEEEEELGHVDQGAWTGGEWVLGDGSGSGISGISSGSGGSGVSGISGGFSARQASGELGQGSSGGDIMNGGQDTSRREAMAKAAEARIRLKQQQQQQGQQQGQQQQKQKQKPKGEEEEKK